MPFPSPSGSHTTNSTPVNEQPEHISDVYDQTTHIRDASVERTAFSSEDYLVDNNLVLGFIEGHKILVTYYHQETSTLNQRSSPSDTTAKRDHIELPVSKISNFELILPSNMANLDWNQESSAGTVTGEGMVHAGFEARVGDLFIYSLGNGLVGLFKISSVQPLSIHSNTTHRVSFTLKRANLDQVQRDELENRVIKHLYFDKTAFLTGNRTLLTSESKQKTDKIKRLRMIMMDFFYKEFFSHVLGSVVSPAPERSFDPYIVEFLNKIVSLEHSGKRLKQLYPNYGLTFDRTLWSRLLSPYNNSLKRLVSNYKVGYLSNSYVDVGSTGLTNRLFTTIVPDSNSETSIAEIQEGYILSQKFYDNDVTEGTGMSDFEKVVKAVIETGKVPDIDILISTYLETFYELEPIEQFRYIPILIYLCDVATTQLLRE